jgi:hypothetical protein
MFKAPAIFFPSTVVFLDDDPLYAKLLIERLKLNRLKHFESPDFLLRQKSDDFLFVDGDIFKKSKMSDFDYVKNNLSTIRKAGTLISVIVSDLHMGDCSGTDLFSQITSPYIGRILVSNFIDYQKGGDVAEARNNGFVDILLDKTKNFVEDLPKAILAAKIKFFTALSNTLFARACRGHALTDTEFAKFFVGKIEELKPEEIQVNSSFNRFTFSFDGQPNLVIQVTEKNEILSYLESSAAESAPTELLAHLSTGKYMLCHEDDVLPDGKMWPLFIRPAKQFDGKYNRYFYNISEAR